MEFVGRRNKNIKRNFGVIASLAAGLLGLYYYQPQRIDFCPRPAPDPNPPIDPYSEDLFSPGTRVAVVAAHPDDPEFYIGGLLTKLGRSGAKIRIIMCTDGDKGYYPSFLTNAAENRRVRQLEQNEAAAEYGAEVVYLHEPDGRLRASAKVVDEIRRQLDEFQPDYVLCFDPLYPPRLQHSDHLRSGEATEEAVKSISSAKWLLRYSTHAANFHVDITHLWEVKEELLSIHKSQFNQDRKPMIMSLVRSRAQADGRAINVSLAEGFRCTRLS